MTAARTSKVFGDVIWSSLFAVNIRFSLAGTDYFAEDQFVSPVQHFWSLAVEEQFYLIWPFLILILCLFSKGRTSAPKDEMRSILVRRIGIVTIAAIILSFAWSVWLTPLNPTVAYFSPFTRAWQLGMGAALAVYATRIPAASDSASVFLSWLGLFLIVIAAVSYTTTTEFPGYAAAAPVLGAAFIIFAGMSNKPLLGARVLLERKPMRFIGDISYSLYLWHWPVLIIPPAYLGRPMVAMEQIAAVAVSFALATMSYKYIEIPIRDSRNILKNRRQSLTLWPVSVASIFITIALLQSGYQSTSENNLAAGNNTSAIVGDANDAQIRMAVYEAARLATAGESLPTELWPRLENLFDDVSRPPAGCGAQRDGITHKICELGDTNASKTVVFFGDSHVGMWYHALLPAIKERGWKLVTFWKASCFPADVTLWRMEKKRPYTECTEFRNWAMQEMRKLQPDKIIVAGLVRGLPVEPSVGKPSSNARGTVLMQSGMTTMLEKLQSISSDVVLLSGTPYLEREPLDCLGSRKADRSTCVIPPDSVTVARNEALRLAAAEKNVNYVDLMPWFCHDKVCPLVVGSQIVYRDTNHVSMTYANTLAKELTLRVGL